MEQIHKDIRIIFSPPTGFEKGLGHEVYFKIKDKETGKAIGSFYMSPFPGCCGIVVVHNLWVYPEYRGSKFSDQIREIKTILAELFGYTAIVATTVVTDVPAVGNMKKSGYSFVFDFINSRTGNKVALGAKLV